jgi:uncharacterized protein YecE (DUF72 family)
MGRILIGTAGWSYADWRGRVYPPGAGARFDALAYLSRFVDLLEINTSFYRLPSSERVRDWLKRTREREDFRFLMKIPQTWTHGTGPPVPAEVDALRRLADLLAEADRLGALLMQFPWSFRNNAENRATVAELAGLLAGYPLAVETRHGGFDRAQWRRDLDRLGAWPVNVDQPRVGDCLALAAHAPRAGAYFRFHGRNAANWFDPEAGRDQRYDYLYSEAELDELAIHVRRAAEAADEVFVVTNNHFRGQALVNALQLKFRFTRERIAAPAALMAHYPALRAIARAEAGSQGELF